jgi:hypothetical protein
MSIFNKESKINAFVKLGIYLQNPDQELTEFIVRAKNKNAWFTEEQVKNALAAIGKSLNANDLEQWLSPYNFTNNAKKIGLVLAGNIPLVGFHDILSVLISGNVAQIKLSSNDDSLIPTVLRKLVEIEPAFENSIQFVNRLEGFDAIIATGSNNTSRYFEYYFSKVPHIIRKNRNSVAILSGNETKDDFVALGKDIFSYFGLGCRNVSKLYVPKGYNFIPFFDAIEGYNPIINHQKYNNNYDYNKSIYLVNKVQHLDNGFLLVTPNESLSSPLSVVYYEEYGDADDLRMILENRKEEIQVVVSQDAIDLSSPIVKFGESQKPQLWDYADGIDTMKFLSGLA